MTQFIMTRARLLEIALEIGNDYEADGMQLGLRQLYYQFVGRGLLDELATKGDKQGHRAYKRIGEVLTEARLTGEFPLDQMVDRGRHVMPGEFTRRDVDAAKALDDAGPLIQQIPEILLGADRWTDQTTFVSVWIEKEALASVFEPVCDELAVSWFACKGYPSVSALWAWLQRAREVLREGAAEKCVILYFGDHDPDGLEIPRSAERNLHQLMDLKGMMFEIEIKRVALTMAQIKKYKPPPFDAKVGARQQAYIKETGIRDAWELDALEPRVLRDLIRLHVEEHFDIDVHDRLAVEVERARKKLRAGMADEKFIRAALKPKKAR